MGSCLAGIIVLVDDLLNLVFFVGRKCKSSFKSKKCFVALALDYLEKKSLLYMGVNAAHNFSIRRKFYDCFDVASSDGLVSQNHSYRLRKGMIEIVSLIKHSRALHKLNCDDVGPR